MVIESDTRKFVIRGFKKLYKLLSEQLIFKFSLEHSIINTCLILCNRTKSTYSCYMGGHLYIYLL
jgi:hypothetical protein